MKSVYAILRCQDGNGSGCLFVLLLDSWNAYRPNAGRLISVLL